MKKPRTNGTVVSLSGRSKDSGVFVERRTPDGSIVRSMDRDAYRTAVANARSALRKKPIPAG